MREGRFFTRVLLGNTLQLPIIGPEQSKTGFGPRAGFLKEMKEKGKNHFEKPVFLSVQQHWGDEDSGWRGSLRLSL